MKNSNCKNSGIMNVTGSLNRSQEDLFLAQDDFQNNHINQN